MIDFEYNQGIKTMCQVFKFIAESQMRPVAREMDENEHSDPKAYIDFMWQQSKALGKQGAGGMFGGKGPDDGRPKDPNKPKKPSTGNVQMSAMVEMLSWGDAGIYLATPNPGLGGAAVSAVGTDEQKERFMSRFGEGDPKWAAMAITEASCGSDSAAIATTAVLDGDEWVINGEKIFVTSGKRAMEDSEGFTVVWATVDKKAGRAGIKSFIVDHHTPGMTVTKLEKKHGIRASDTAVIVFDECRIPKNNILGSAEVVTKGEGFKGVMATFDATRPMVAASAIGIGRAALEFVEAKFKENGMEPRYGISPQKLSGRERDLMKMQAELKAAWLLTLKASWMADQKLHNNLEASMCKAKAGLAVTQLCQKAVELMGPLGYSRELLLEKWMRDAKINDIFEGTGQINMLIVARRIFGYGKAELA